jgi:hypothetical protein
MSPPDSPALTLAFLAAPGHTGQTITSEAKEGAGPMQAVKHDNAVKLTEVRIPLHFRKQLLYRLRSGVLVECELLIATTAAWRRWPLAFRRRFRRWRFGPFAVGVRLTD